MKTKQLTLKLVGPDEQQGQLDLDDFTAFCDRVRRCLRRLEHIVGQQSQAAKRVRYRIVRLATESPATIMLEAVSPSIDPKRGEQAIGLFCETVERLQTGRDVDSRVGTLEIEAFGELLEGKAKEVWIDGVHLTSKYTDSVKRLLSSVIPSEGSVTGMLERLNVHGKNEFILYPPIGDWQIDCHFPVGLLDQVREAIKRNITVQGMLYGQPDRPYPDRVRVRSIEIHPRDSELPTLSELRGSFGSDCTGGLSAVNFIRSLRDEA
jgi:hypothetical protein